MTDFIQRLLGYIAGLDPVWAPVAFISLYILATVLFIPGSLITLCVAVLVSLCADGSIIGTMA